MQLQTILAILAWGVSPAVLASPIEYSSFNVTKRATGAGFTPNTPAWRSSNSPDTQAPFVSLDNGIDYYFQSDGNIVCTQNGNVQWASYKYATCANGVCQLVFQGDGNLVAYDGNGNSFFSTGTNAYPGHSYSANQLYFTSASPWIQMYDQNTYLLWQTSGTSGSISNNPDAEVENGLGYVPGESFPSSGAPIAKLHGGYYFQFATDGNIVVSQESNGQFYWAAGCGGRNCGEGGCKLTFQSNGDLVAIDNTVNPPVSFWHTGTYRQVPTYHESANELFFSNSEPYISLYEGDGQGDNERLWITTGTSGFTRFDPDAPEKGPSGPSGGGPPCGEVPCVTCDSDCSGESDPNIQPD